MGDVVDFPSKEKKLSYMDLVNPEKTYTVTESGRKDIEDLYCKQIAEKQMYRKLADKNFNDFLIADLKVAAFKRMTLWDRIFNWPYGRE